MNETITEILKASDYWQDRLAKAETKEQHDRIADHLNRIGKLIKKLSD